MRLRTVLKGTLLVVAIVAVTLLAIRAYDSQRGAPLKPWHTYVPEEPDATALDQMNWAEYIKAENALFESVRQNVTEKLDPDDQVADNRYYKGSPVYPAHFSTDWNHSYIMEPSVPPVGAVVLLHGLTDSPYSLRHIARRYVAHGFVAIAIRLPGHGTVPAGLSEVSWEEWMAATRLAVREARRRVGPNSPLHLVGFSNGGALALKYALDALDDPSLTRADRLILISPMIGITRFARFAGFAALPALLPPFAKAAWLGILPEFNPFKYNSFPVNGARQSHRLTMALQQRIQQEGNKKRLGQLPPVQTFQSVVDFTVSTRAIVSAFYAHLPENGSELVLFDLNRAAKFGLLMRRSSNMALSRYLNPPPRTFRTATISNADSNHLNVMEHVLEAGATQESSRPLDLAYPANVFSLSHVALPFPMTDGLYGLQPDPAEDYGVQLGATATRGERNVLILSLDAILRMSSNPFYPYMIQRIEEGIPTPLIQADGKESG